MSCNVDIKLIPFEICLIHKPAYSCDSNHSSKFTALVIVAFTKKKKEKRHVSKKTKQQAEQTHKLLVSNLVFVRESYLFCALCCVELERVEINNIVRVFKYEYDKYLKF